MKAMVAENIMFFVITDLLTYGSYVIGQPEKIKITGV